jgi:tRNA(fMet)-specific endonuclease VapC
MEIICLDTDILIEHKRAKKREKTIFFDLSTKFEFSTTVITVFELLRGDDSEEDRFWKDFFARIPILNMDIDCSEIAGAIYRDLKQKGTMIGTEDILIASIAMKHKMKLATNNNRDFGRIDGLIVVE